jgi:hypothetical protein
MSCCLDDLNDLVFFIQTMFSSNVIEILIGDLLLAYECRSFIHIILLEIASFLPSVLFPWFSTTFL